MKLCSLFKYMYIYVKSQHQNLILLQIVILLNRFRKINCVLIHVYLYFIIIIISGFKHHYCRYIFFLLTVDELKRNKKLRFGSLPYPLSGKVLHRSDSDPSMLEDSRPDSRGSVDVSRLTVVLVLYSTK